MIVKLPVICSFCKKTIITLNLKGNTLNYVGDKTRPKFERHMRVCKEFKEYHDENNRYKYELCWPSRK